MKNKYKSSYKSNKQDKNIIWDEDSIYLKNVMKQIGQICFETYEDFAFSHGIFSRINYIQQGIDYDEAIGGEVKRRLEEHYKGSKEIKFDIVYYYKKMTTKKETWYRIVDFSIIVSRKVGGTGKIYKASRQFYRRNLDNTTTDPKATEAWSSY